MESDQLEKLAKSLRYVYHYMKVTKPFKVQVVNGVSLRVSVKRNRNRYDLGRFYFMEIVMKRPEYKSLKTLISYTYKKYKRICYK